MQYLQNVAGNYPIDYFSEENVNYIQNKVKRMLGAEFNCSGGIIVPASDIVRVMQRVIGQRMEGIPEMNQRTIMYITDAYRTHVIDANKHLKWAENYTSSQQLYDMPFHKSAMPMFGMKLKRNKVGGTINFWFT